LRGACQNDFRLRSKSPSEMDPCHYLITHGECRSYADILSQVEGNSQANDHKIKILSNLCHNSEFDNLISPGSGDVVNLFAKKIGSPENA